MRWRTRRPGPAPRHRGPLLIPILAFALGGLLLLAVAGKSAVTAGPATHGAGEVTIQLKPRGPVVDIDLVLYRDVPAPRPRPILARAAPEPAEPAGPAPPRIALVIDDMGLDAARSARVADLRAALTLSYLPYAPAVRDQAEAARAQGHELLVHVPMEALGADIDPGPNALMIALSPAENVRRLRWALDRFDGFVGVNNHMGSRFTTDPRALAPVLRELKRRGLLFVDSLTAHGSAGRSLARSIGLRFAARDVFLDHESDPAAIRRRLALLEEIARAAGAAVGIGHPRDATIAALEEWIPDVQRRGFALVPVSRLVGEELLITAPRHHDGADGPA